MKGMAVAVLAFVVGGFRTRLSSLGQRTACVSLLLIASIGVIGATPPHAPATANLTFELAFGGSNSGPGRLLRPNDVATDGEGNAWVADSQHQRIQVFDSSGMFAHQFGSVGKGDGQFMDPTGVAVDAESHVWVIDRGGNRIQHFDSEGEFIGKFGSEGSADGQFSQPRSIAVDAEGDIWVADAGNDRIQQFDSEGTFIGKISGGLKHPTGVAIDAEGDIWVADMLNSKVKEFDSEGKLIRSFGSWGTGDGQFARPYDVAIDAEGNAWVADSRNDRIQQFDAEGSYLSQFGSVGANGGQFFEPLGIGTDAEGSVWVADTYNNRVQEIGGSEFLGEFGGEGPGGLSAPDDVAIDPEGSVWVADTDHDRIQQFDSEGKFVRQFGGTGPGDGEFYVPASVAADSEGNVWVVDSSLQRIQQFDSEGKFIRSVGGQGTEDGQFSYLREICIDSEGNLWALESLGFFLPARIQKFDSEGEFLGAFTGEFETLSEEGEFEWLSDIGVDAEGTVWLLDTGNDRVVEFSSEGEFLGEFGMAGSGEGQFDEPSGMAIGPGGDIWVTDTGNNRLESFASDGTYLSQFGTAGSNDGQFFKPRGIATDAEGNVWVADSGNDRIQAIGGSEYRRQFGGDASGAGHLVRPNGVALDSEGNAWVTDTGHDRIQQFDAEGKFVRQLGIFGTGDGELYSPEGIATDSEGNVWVADTYNNRIQQFDAKGNYLSQFGSVGSAQGKLNRPRDIAIDAVGHVWVADTNNNRVQEFDPDGKFVRQIGSQGSEPGLLSKPGGLAIGAGGHVWVADTANNRVQRFHPEGEFLGAFGSQGNEDGQLESPTDVAIDHDGIVWVSDTGNHRLQAFSAAGTYLDQLGAGGNNSGEVQWPGGLAFDSERNLWVADKLNDRVQKWRYSAPPAAVPDGATGLSEEAATLNGIVNPNGNETSYRFEYVNWWYFLISGFDEALSVPIPDKAIGAKTADTPVSQEIDGLAPGAVYVYRVFAESSEGTTYSEEDMFTTPIPPAVTTHPAVSIKEHEATLKGSVNPNGWDTTYQFEYGTTTSYGWKIPLPAKSIGSDKSAVSLGETISGLGEGVTYHYRLKATNSVGQVAFGKDQTLTTLDPPQTTITTPTPSYTAHEVDEIEFESDQPGSVFKCGLDEGDEPTKPCESPYVLPQYLEGWHTFAVVAENEEALEDPTPSKWIFNPSIYPDAPSTSKLVTPNEGAKSGSHFTLKSQWKSWEEVSSVSYQLKAPGWDAFKTIPPKYLTGSDGKQPPGWILEVDYKDGASPPLAFDIGAFAEAEGWDPVTEGLQLRPVFNGEASAAGAGEPATITYSRFGGGPGDAVEQIGPASLDLLTGAFTISRTDVSIPVPGTEANLEFTRTYSSAWGANEKTNSKTLGPMWQPSAPVESEYEEEAWQKLLVQHRDAVPPVYNEECKQEVEAYEEELKEFEEWEGPLDPDTCLEEDEIPEQNWVEVLGNDGTGIPFERTGEGPDYTWVPPEEAKEYALTKSGSTFNLGDANGTHTTFSQNGSTNEYVPSEISFAGTEKTATLLYDISEGKKRLKKIVGPAPAGVKCNPSESEEGGKNYALKTPGCRTLVLNYISFKVEAEEESTEQRLERIIYYNSSGNPETSETVARYGYYSASGNLSEVWDPRLPELVEEYTYASTEHARLTRLDPVGTEPWDFNYYPAGSAGAWEAKLKSVKRASLLEEGPETATTTITYGVPIMGEDAPYDLGASAIAKWDQQDYPVDATAIFPPTEVPAEEPSDYDEATIHYLDPDGHEVNTASPSPPGVEGDSIMTRETDEHGNVVRELSSRNRLKALQDKKPAERAQELDTESIYSWDGTNLQHVWSPVHRIRFEDKWFLDARIHTFFEYDKGAPKLKEGETAPRLPTREFVAAVRIDLENYEFDRRTTLTKYDWTLRKPTETTVDPFGLPLVSKTVYNSAGQVIEERQPSDPEGKDAGSTKTVYWTAGANSEESACGNKAAWAGLPCLTRPVAEPSPSGENPKLPWTWFKKYSSLDQLEETQEKTNGVLKRTTTITYDSADRPLRTHVTGEEGTAIPPVETTYDEKTGVPVSQHFVCEEEECAEFDIQQTRTKYDDLGRPIEYEDADGSVSEVGYDLMGRPALTFDGKGYRAVAYDEASGVATKLTDSAAGTFKATYNADGQMTEQLLPNGLAQRIDYDETGAAVGLSYEKQAYCFSSCTWLDFDRQYSAAGQVLRETNTFGTREYTYDKAGRLTLAKDTEGGKCTTRAYTFDENTNRTSLTTRAPKEGGGCNTESKGEVQAYEYDTADRLIGEGIEYDNLGRINELPGEYAGGGKLSTDYYVNDLTRSQSQGGVTNTYELDAALRQRQRTRTGGSEEGAEIYHYAGGSDSPSWIDEGGSKWTRSIGALGGSLGALQTSSGEITFQIADMHGDVIATADDDPEASELLSTQRFDEYGNPQQSGFLEGGDAEYGWLGAKRRRTQLFSGVIQMGARSYVPSLGRFLTPDPIRGGSANAYEYAGGDPINNFDLTGECYVTRRPSPGKCKKKDMKKYKGERRKARSVSRRSVTIVLIERRGGGARASGIGDALKDALDYVHDKVGGGVKKIGNGFASLTLSGPEYKAARRAFALSMAWSPDRLIQAWQCGEYVAGVGRSFGDCDPWEMYNGAPPDSAR